MIRLDATTKKLEAVLDGAVTTNQLTFETSYADYSSSTWAQTGAASNDGVTNNTTPVTLVAAPGASTIRHVQHINIYNKDTVDAVVTVQYDNNGTDRELLTFTLAPGDTLEYMQGHGWKVLDSNGALKAKIGTSNVDIDGGSIDGTTIGANSAAAGTFTDLTVNGDTTLGNASGDSLTVNPSSVTWANNPTHSGNHTFSGTVTATGNRVNVSGITAGVLITETDGTTTHNATLLVSNNDSLDIQTRDNTGSFVGSDYTISHGASGATIHSWKIEGSEAARIDSNSTLLIGTTTAASGNPRVDIAGSSPQLTLSNTVSDATSKFPNFAGRHYTNSEESVSLIGAANTSSDNTTRYGGGSGSLNAATIHSFYTAANNTTLTGTEQIRFAHTANNILQDTKFGGSVGDTPSAIIHGEDSVAGIVGLFDNQHASTPDGITIDFSAASPDDNTQFFLKCEDSTQNRCIIYSDGDIQNADNSYTGISDAKLKQDIEDSGSQWEDIKAIAKLVRRYRLKDDVERNGEEAKRKLGLVAQELEAISPGLVRDNPDTETTYEQKVDDDGNPVYRPVYETRQRQRTAEVYVLNENGEQVMEEVEVTVPESITSEGVLIPEYTELRLRSKTRTVDVVDAEGNPVMEDYEEQVGEEPVMKRVEKPTGTHTKSVKYSILYMKAVKALGEALERIEKIEDALVSR